MIPLTDREVVELQEAFQTCVGDTPEWDWMPHLSDLCGRRIDRYRDVDRRELPGILRALRSVPGQRQREVERQRLKETS